ncbi:MAG: helix-turn-helix domain-containing protein, partial [Pseudomonadota bacterium]
MKPQKSELSRGSLSRLTGVNAETIRYYEKIGVMPLPMRSDAGHRTYDQASVKRLFFVKRSRELGFTLKEIQELLRLVDGEDFTCAEVRDKTNAHLADVTRKIGDLQKIEQTLTTMVSKCDGGELPNC